MTNLETEQKLVKELGREGGREGGVSCKMKSGPLKGRRGRVRTRGSGGERGSRLGWFRKRKPRPLRSTVEMTRGLQKSRKGQEVTPPPSAYMSLSFGSGAVLYIYTKTKEHAHRLLYTHTQKKKLQIRKRWSQWEDLREHPQSLFLLPFESSSFGLPHLLPLLHSMPSSTATLERYGSQSHEYALHISMPRAQ